MAKLARDKDPDIRARVAANWNTDEATLNTLLSDEFEEVRNAAAREHGLTYGRLVDGLTKAGIEVDRKVLADIAVHEPEAFKALAEKAKSALA